MPFIQAHIAAGLTHARKRQLIHEIVAVTCEAIGSDPKIINVVIHEHDETNMCISGRVADGGND
jgi:4-oxalocrotonate tautomerase/trans-3-chloroacrylic acid dehalogenase beta subunit